MSTLALAIQTIPDIETGRRLYNISGLSDEGVAKAMFHLQQQRTGSEALPLYLQKIVSIAIAEEIKGELHVELLADRNQDTNMDTMSEDMLLQHYVKAIKNKQQLTWQGANYDFPILRYRALKYGIKLSALNTAMQLDLSQQFEANTSVPSLSDMVCLLNLTPVSIFKSADIWQAYLTGEQAQIDSTTKQCAENIYRIYQAI